MEELFASFLPTDDVIHLLSDLRLAGLQWIADEIETAIRNGNTLLVSNQKSNQKDTYKTVPFDAREQLWLTLHTIRRYTVDMYETWNWTQSYLQQTLAEPNLQLSIVLPDDITELSVFEGDVGEHFTRLGELLKKALSNKDVYS